MAQRTYGRTAFGRQRTMTVAQKARYVAESILRHDDAGQAWTWAQYGIEEGSAQHGRVLAVLTQERQG